MKLRYITSMNWKLARQIMEKSGKNLDVEMMLEICFTVCMDKRKSPRLITQLLRQKRNQLLLRSKSLVKRIKDHAHKKLLLSILIYQEKIIINSMQLTSFQKKDMKKIS